VSLIDRVRYLAGGITVQQSRAVVAEVYRRIGEGTLAATNPHDLALVLVAHANGLIQQNAADTISGVEPPLSLPTDQLVDPDVERLCRAREALVATDYFTAEQVGDDIAARITELHAALAASPLLCNLAAWRSIDAPACALPLGHEGRHRDSVALRGDLRGEVWS
jgi:hypothetical protein